MAKVLRKRENFGKVSQILDVPYLIEIQRKSFEIFLQKEILPGRRKDVGLQAAFKSVFPITDYNETATIDFIEYSIGEPKFSTRECILKGTNFSAPIKIKVRLNLFDVQEDGSKKLREAREQEVFIGEIPLMTDTGTFIINGTERVIVSQLHRSPGVCFSVPIR
jgi:DNA-directed RNA polymerase subunit beta